jgi:hypothetical protein
MNNTVLVIIFVAAAIGILLYISKSMASKTDPEETAAEMEKELTERFHMGQCLSGMPNMAQPFPIVFCGVTENDFVFRMGTKGSEIGRIPRGNIRSITIDNKHCLKIDWNDAHGAPFSTVFDFGKNCEAEVDRTKNGFNTWMKASV